MRISYRSREDSLQLYSHLLQYIQCNEMFHIISIWVNVIDKPYSSYYRYIFGTFCKKAYKNIYSSACRCVRGVCDNRPEAKGACKPQSCQQGIMGELCNKHALPCGPSQKCHIQANCLLDQVGEQKWVSFTIKSKKIFQINSCTSKDWNSTSYMALFYFMLMHYNI